MARLNKGNAAEYQHSEANVSRLRRIADSARSIGIAARAARAAEREAYRQTPATTARPDRRTKAYRDAAGKLALSE